MRPVVTAFLVAAALGFAASSCSLTTATGFVECHVDTDCGSRGACSHGYCVTLPARCQRTEGSFNLPDRIPIAALLPIHDQLDGGELDDSEVAGLNAMRLAVREVNELQGLKGRLFGLFTCDTGRDSAEITSEVKWFVTQLEAPAIITSGSNQTIDAYTATGSAGTLIMSATATSEDLSVKYGEQKSVWRTAPPDSLQALVLSRLLRLDLTYLTPSAPSKIGIIYQDGAYGRGLSHALTKDLVNTYAKDVREFTFTSPVDANGVLNEVVNYGPQATVLVAFPSDVKQLVRAAKLRPSLTRANNHRWAFSDSAKDPIIIDSFTAPEIDGMKGTIAAMGAGIAFKDFQGRYKSRFGVDPADYGYTGQSYDAMYCVMFAAAAATAMGTVNGPNMNLGMKQLSVTGNTVYDVGGADWTKASTDLLSGKGVDLEGASGKLDFDLSTGAAPAPYEVWTAHADGGFTSVVQ